MSSQRYMLFGSYMYYDRTGTEGYLGHIMMDFTTRVPAISAVIMLCGEWGVVVSIMWTACFRSEALGCHEN